MERAPLVKTLLQPQDPESLPMKRGLLECEIIGSFLVPQDKNKQEHHLTWIGVALGMHHSELAVLLQNVEVTVSLHRLGKKPVLMPRSTAPWLLNWVESWQGCGR